MGAARADLTIDGPGVRMHLHGDGPLLVADVRGGFRLVALAAANIVRIVRFQPKLSHSLRQAGLRVEVRLKGTTVMRFG
jgi:hypothetical protein